MFFVGAYVEKNMTVCVNVVTVWLCELLFPLQKDHLTEADHHKEDVFWKICGPEIYAGKHAQTCGKHIKE